MSEINQQPVSTPDVDTALCAALARSNEVPISSMLVGRISDEDWNSDSHWEGNIACGSSGSDHHELDFLDKVGANVA